MVTPPLETPPDISVTIAGVHFRNPVIAASGTFGYGREYARFTDCASLGGICTKGLTLTPRAGNTGERLWETPSGLLNSIGLENPGIPAFIEHELPALRALGPAILANLSGSSLKDYAEGARLLSDSPVDMIELNISCPNVQQGGMAFGLDPDTAAAVVRTVRKSCAKPLCVKLSPNAPHLIKVALSCVHAGADALSLVNTFKAMAIDTRTRKPVFDNITAGLSGPAIRPIALRMVWELTGELRRSSLPTPVIGMGGICCANDALEFLMAGASAIEVGSATFAHPAAMTHIIEGISQYLKTAHFSSLASLRIPH
ncbi:MAG: dihydroorotate dehydrogenase [Spirochaetaceae bacterium]|jgi:dihydroorotate dehydrogenase (NAD+) catalytic subunit|nr:dihydroorotate dehydrogenase [Spirochaetaceae bacterium]